MMTSFTRQLVFEAQVLSILPVSIKQSSYTF